MGRCDCMTRCYCMDRCDCMDRYDCMDRGDCLYIIGICSIEVTAWTRDCIY